MKKSRFLMLACVVGTALSLASCGQSNTTSGNTNTSGSVVTTGGGNADYKPSYVVPKLATAETQAVENKEIYLSGAGTVKDFSTKWANQFLADSGLKDQGFKITYVAHGEDKIDTEVTDWTSLTSPDVYGYAVDKTPALVASGALAEVPDAFSSKLKEELTDSSYQTGVFANTVRGYAYTASNGYFMYYDKSKVGSENVKDWDLDQWIDFAKKNNYKIAYPFKTAFYSAGALTTFGASWTATYNERTGKLTKVESNFNSDEGKKAAKFINKFIASGVYSDTQAAPEQNSDVLVCVNGPWALDKDDKGNVSKYAADNVDVLPLPSVTVDGVKKHIRSFAGTKAYGVNPQKSQGNAARTNILHNLAYYLTSDVVQDARFDDAQSAPSNKNVASESKVKQNKYVSVLAEQSADGVPQANIPDGVWNAPNALIQKMIDTATKENRELNDSELETALTTLDTGIQTIASDKN